MALKIFSFRLDEGLVARIDATGLKRSVFVRDALEAALGDVDAEAPMRRSAWAMQQEADPLYEALSEPVRNSAPAKKNS